MRKLTSLLMIVTMLLSLPVTTLAKPEKISKA